LRERRTTLYSIYLGCSLTSAVKGWRFVFSIGWTA